MTEGDMSGKDLFDRLRDAVVRGDPAAAANLATEAVESGIDPLIAYDEGLRKGITEVGDGFACGDLFLPDLVIAADAMKGAAEILEAEITRSGGDRQALGTVVIGTAAGDLHDIGKTILGTMLNANGFDVVDVGVNVPAEDFIEAVRVNQPQVLGMSSLLTITAKELASVIEKLAEAGLRDQLKVIVGGGAVTAEYADQIGADGYGHDAELGVRLVKALLDV
jgi:corrinoid protein of di/trimethylamine methyltransferase